MVILIDNGHGCNVVGKQSPLLEGSGVKVGYELTENGRFKEWKYTRLIAEEVVSSLKSMGYDARLVVPEKEDIPLSVRVDRINDVCRKYGAGNVIMISIHANAVGDSSQWMTGKGWEAYTTKGKTKSDTLAEFLYKRADKYLKNRKVRKDTTDGDSDKEANFFIIKNANCPAVLTENFFYDNKDDLGYLTSDEGIHVVERIHIEGILDYINYLGKGK